mmetsp:Transcript_19940/g.37041  ORF Transcript_19940/g.37041 Transcript_19940/m.37041 type:complete len:97 (+) Transcript_19940:150-440(+)
MAAKSYGASSGCDVRTSSGTEAFTSGLPAPFPPAILELRFEGLVALARYRFAALTSPKATGLASSSAGLPHNQIKSFLIPTLPPVQPPSGPQRKRF